MADHADAPGPAAARPAGRRRPDGRGAARARRLHRGRRAQGGRAARRAGRGRGHRDARACSPCSSCGRARPRELLVVGTRPERAALARTFGATDFRTRGRGAARRLRRGDRDRRVRARPRARPPRCCGAAGGSSSPGSRRRAPRASTRPISSYGSWRCTPCSGRRRRPGRTRCGCSAPGCSIPLPLVTHELPLDRVRRRPSSWWGPAIRGRQGAAAAVSRSSRAPVRRLPRPRSVPAYTTRPALRPTPRTSQLDRTANERRRTARDRRLAHGSPPTRRAGARRARPGRARPLPRRRLAAHLPGRRPLAHRDPLRRGARGPRRRPQGVLAARRADPPDQPGQRRLDADRRRDHRDGRGRPPNATSSSACSPARAAPGTSARSVRTDSRGGGLRARGHDAVAGCVEDAVRATELGVKCLLVADEGVLWTLHRAREPGIIPADTTLKVSALIGPGQPGRVRRVRAARRATRSTCRAI